MAQETNKISLVDLDVYGRTSNAGGALVHQDDFAISNAIIFFLTTKRGDYLYRPSLGGLLDRLLFKLLDIDKARFYGEQIANELDNEFGALLDDIEVIITPNFEERYYEVNVYYTSIQTRESNQAVFFTRPKNEISQRVYQDVEFVGDNLLAFVALQKEKISDKLILNARDEVWYWGNFRLVNFNQSSDNFQEIFDIING